MARWEYTNVDWYWSKGKEIFVFFPNDGKKTGAGDEDKALQVLNDLGRDGWEIITSTSGDDHQRGPWTSWTLKREIK